MGEEHVEGLIKISKGNCINFQNVDYENQVSFKPLWEVWLSSCLNSPVWRDGGRGRGRMNRHTRLLDMITRITSYFFSASVYFISMYYYSLIYNKKLRTKRG